MIADSPLRDRLIFVVGARRSGTNWLHRIISSHPDVVGATAETNLFDKGIAPLAGRFQHAVVGSLETGRLYIERSALLDALRGLCDAVFAGLLDRAGGSARSRFCDHSPGHTRVLDLLGAVYPDGWVVHIVRDGRDVARSLASMPWGPGSVEAAAAEWRDAVDAASAAAPALARYTEVRYEDLLADPHAQIRTLFEAMQLPADRRVLDGAVEAAASPFNVDPALPTIAAGKWRRGLDAPEVAVVEDVCGAALARFGYLTDHAGAGGRAATTATGVKAEAPAETAAPEAADGFVAEMLARLKVGNETVSRFLDHLASGRRDAARALLAPGAVVTVVDGVSGWSGQDAGDADRFVDEAIADAAWAGRQLRGDVHPSVPGFTVVTVTERGGDVLARIWILAVEGGAISRAALHRYRVSGGPDPGGPGPGS
jgi:hypothetical protein